MPLCITQYEIFRIYVYFCTAVLSESQHSGKEDHYPFVCRWHTLQGPAQRKLHLFVSGNDKRLRWGLESYPVREVCCCVYPTHRHPNWLKGTLTSHCLFNRFAAASLSVPNKPFTNDLRCNGNDRVILEPAFLLLYLHYSCEVSQDFTHTDWSMVHCKGIALEVSQHIGTWHQPDCYSIQRNLDQHPHHQVISVFKASEQYAVCIWESVRSMGRQEVSQEIASCRPASINSLSDFISRQPLFISKLWSLLNIYY